MSLAFIPKVVGLGHGHDEKLNGRAGSSLTRKLDGIVRSVKPVLAIPPWITRGAVLRLGALFFLLIVFALWGWGCMVAMPGKSFAGPLPQLSIAFIGNFGSRSLVRRAVGRFRAAAGFRSQGAALPGWVLGVGWSDHWSFWQHGYQAIMVTDTLPFRYPQYHTAADAPKQVDARRMALVVDALEAVIADLAGTSGATRVPNGRDPHVRELNGRNPGAAVGP